MVTLPGRKGKVTGVYQVHITLWEMRMCDWLKMDNASGNRSWDGMLCANIAIECLIKMLMLFCLNVLFTLWPTFFKFGHLLSEKGSLLTRQAVHTRTFTWKAAWKIQLYFTKVLLHTFESEQSTTCFQQHETSVSQLNLFWFMLRITDLFHGQHLGTDWPQFSHMICVSAGPTTAEQDGHTPTPQQSCKLTLFSTTKKRRKKERYWNIGVKTPSHFTVCKNRVQP